MMIPICVKANVATQKFRIPFRNLNPTSDTDIDFTFVKLPTKQIALKDKSSEENSDSDTTSESKEAQEEVNLLQYLEFYCQPNLVKLSAG